MNRNEEYHTLLAALEQTPLELEYAVQRALARKKASSRKRRLLGIPAGSLAVCFLAFMLLVNLFPPFAMACGNIPLLRELAKAVAWSPSLSAAVEHDYVQPLELEQTAEDITARVEYVIVDRKQVTIFYSLSSKEYDSLDADYSVQLPDEQGGYSSSGSYGAANGELQHITVDFIETDVPDTLGVTLKVYDSTPDWDSNEPAIEADYGDTMLEAAGWEEPDYLAVFAFVLDFDPYYTARGEVIQVDQGFILDGQTVTLTQAEAYPTHLRVNLSCNSGNTAWLKGLDFYLENEHGERFQPATNGIAATGSPDPEDQNMASFWLGSPWFSQGEHLTLHITGAAWLDKERGRVRVNLVNGTAETLPDGVRIEWTERRDGGWVISTSTPYRWGNTTMYQTWDGSYYDAAGTEYQMNSRSATTTPIFLGTLSGEALEEHETYEKANQDRYFEAIPLRDYADNEVWLVPSWTSVTTQDTPVSVPIK